MADIALRLLDWERDDNPLAPLTEKQKFCLNRLSEAATSRRGNTNKPGASVSGNTHLGDLRRELSDDDNETDSLLKKNIVTTHQFLEWFSHIENEIVYDECEKYRKSVNQLKDYSKECTKLLNEVEAALEFLNTLNRQYQLVSNKTNNLHEACEHLLAEQTKLVDTAESISDKLTYFDEVNKISQKLSSPTLAVTNESFIPMLARLDECIAFLKENAHYRESPVFLVRFRHCLARALNMIQNYVLKSLQSATQQVMPLKEAQNLTGNAFTMFYVKFRTNAPRIKTLMEQIEIRVNHTSEYQQLLSDCHQCYFTQRNILITPSVASAIAELAGTHVRDHCTMVRSGCKLLLHISEDEHQLYFQFFSKPSDQLDVFLGSLCGKLYDTLRPLVIHIHHLETLAELCSILKVEMLEEHVHNNGCHLIAFEMFIKQMLEDIQERLVYRSHVYIQTDILKYKPATGDLAYPEKLEMMESIAESLNPKLSRSDSQSSLASSCSITSQEVAAITLGSEQRRSQSRSTGYSPADLHGMWYPTVRRTLSCLSKLYRCIDRAIFQGVSQEALSACIQSLILAGGKIATNRTPLDGQLFQIKHVLILREQITPFQMDFTIRETSLDFTNIKNAAVNLLQKRSRLFSLSSNNSLLEFIAQGTPHVTEHFRDSKKEVDNYLKAVCDDLISYCTMFLCGPLIEFLEKAKVVLTAKDEKTLSIQLKNQPFASSEQVAGIITEANRQLKSKLVDVQSSMALYLSNRETESILFRPIRNNILSIYQQVLEIIRTHYSEDDFIVIGCPTREQVNVMLSR